MQAKCRTCSGICQEVCGRDAEAESESAKERSGPSLEAKVSWLQHLSLQGKGKNQGTFEKLEAIEAKAEGNDQQKPRDEYAEQDSQTEPSDCRLGELLLSGYDEVCALENGRVVKAKAESVLVETMAESQNKI